MGLYRGWSASEAKKRITMDLPSSKAISIVPSIIDLYGELATREDHGYAVRK